MTYQEGIISGIFGAYYKIIPRYDLDREYDARLRGKLRLERKKSEHTGLRHLLIVGDRIEYENKDNEEYTIINLLERKNMLMRSSEFESHALGANIDRAVLIQSIVSPELKINFVDRFLASCYAGNVNPVIVFTKPDLAESVNSPHLLTPEKYLKLGYSVFVLNLLSQNDSEELGKFKSICENGVSLFSGNSGTGKSTIINKLFERNVQKTSHISSSTGKGRHTTTNSRLFISENKRAMYIDTPGVKEWGISHLSADQIYASFPEINPYISQCKFNNCDHSANASGCRIQEIINLSVENAANPPISLERLKSMNAMLDSLQYSGKIRTGDYIKETGRIRSGKIKKRNN